MMMVDPHFTDEELDQAEKALGIRLGSLSSKARRVTGGQRTEALAEYQACEAALAKCHKAVGSRLGVPANA